MWIERYITREVVTIGPQENIVTARDLMSAHRIRHLPVVDAENRLMGIVSDRDIRSAMSCLRDGPPDPVSEPMVAEIMTTDLLTISPDFTLQDALLQFRMKKVGAFPVTDDEGRVVGILSDRDLLNGFIQVLGLGTPGCFIGLEVAADERQPGAAVMALTEAGIPIASVLVIRDWRPGVWAVFLYVITQNRSAVRHLLSEAGFSMIEPMDWLLSPFQNRAA